MDILSSGIRKSGWGSLTAQVLLGILLLGFSGCDGHGGGGEPGLYSARGTVEDVDRENGQVLIDHADVEGLMPAMTMNFAVPDEAVLEGLARGQEIDFEIRFTGRSYEVEGAQVVGEASVAEGWRRLGDGLVRTSVAPDFELIDQAGKTVSLASLGDRVLIVDFVFTECPGPCPVQTSNQVALQKQIPIELRESIQFVSISLDPEVDQPEVLLRYAKERGADLDHWSFLTGEPETVAQLVTDWGVGSVRKPDGSIDHTLITFLVHQGRVMDHYPAGAGRESELLIDALSLARAGIKEPR